MRAPCLIGTHLILNAFLFLRASFAIRLSRWQALLHHRDFLKKSQAFLFFGFPKGAVETTEPETPLSEGGLQGHTMERKDHVEFYGS